MTDGRLRAAIGLVALAGAAVAAYLVYARYTHTQIACTTGGCETVQHSKYARLAGVPKNGGIHVRVPEAPQGPDGLDSPFRGILTIGCSSIFEQ